MPPAAVRIQRHDAGIAGADAAHLQADHGQVEGIVSHRQFGQKDFSEVPNVNDVAEVARF